MPAQSNLHVVSYSEPVDRQLSLDELRPHLHSIPKLPQAIPYVTSYYRRTWGFCLPHATLERLPAGTYHALIESEFVDGHVVLGSCVLPGESAGEVLLSSYLCHPSLANNELSGPLVLWGLYRRLAAWPRRRFTYRFLLNPETIGSLCYLWLHGSEMRERMVAGLVLTCLGGPSPTLSYKASRRGDSLLDRTVQYLREETSLAIQRRPFDPTSGSDERQYGSPGFNLPVGQMARTVYNTYPGYHNSLDTKEFMGIGPLVESINEIEALLATLELAGTFRNLSPYGEPQLGKRRPVPASQQPAHAAPLDRREHRRPHGAQPHPHDPQLRRRPHVDARHRPPLPLPAGRSCGPRSSGWKGPGCCGTQGCRGKGPSP